MVRQAWSLASTAQKVKFTAGAAGILGLTAATFDPVTNGDAQAPGSTPPSNTDDEEDDATSITMDEAIETGQSLQVTTADGTPVGDFGTEDIARLDDDEAGTLTAADLAYGASFGVNPMEQGDIIEQLGGIDKASVYWDKPSFEEGLRNGDLRSDSFSGYVTSGAPHARYKQRYSYREAINMPMELSNAEIQAWGEKLWEAGFMEANVDLTKPFSEQWVGDRYDPAFQRAWQNMLRTSLMNPEKSAKAILEERRKLRRPLIDKARQEAIDEKVKSTLRSMRLPDPAGINQTVEDQMQERLGRNPTGAETEAIRNQVVGAISEQAKRVLGEEQVSTDIDIAARAEQAIEAMNPVEVLGHDTADAFDMFRSMLGPGGRNG